jgi:hypothetical protein
MLPRRQCSAPSPRQKPLDVFSFFSGRRNLPLGKIAISIRLARAFRHIRRQSHQIRIKARLDPLMSVRRGQLQSASRLQIRDMSAASIGGTSGRSRCLATLPPSGKTGSLTFDKLLWRKSCHNIESILSSPRASRVSQLSLGCARALAEIEPPAGAL